MFLEKFLRFGRSLIPFRIRKLNKEFRSFSSLLKENETKSYEEIRKYQFMMLKKQVDIAYYHTDFYKKKYDDFGFHPKDLKNLSDLQEIPILTKDELRKNSKFMVVNNYKGKIYYGYSSGTTGKPLKFALNKRIDSREWASGCYQWERVGYKPTDGRVEFRGFIEKDVDFIYFPDHRVLRINIIKMSERNIDSIVKKIKRKRYLFYHGYPSALFKFAKILEKKHIQLNPKGILLASEVLYDWQMETIDKVFPNSKKIIHYGQAEKIALGAWDNNRKYYFIPSYGLVETDEINNEIIATGFINDIMPIIRHTMTDTVQGFQEKPLSSGKTLFPIIDTIHGRIEDYTYNLKNEMIPPAVVTFPFKKLKFIKACQIIQNSISELELIIETDERESAIIEANNIVNDLKKIYGEEALFKIHFVDEIPVDPSGKFRWIKCNIKANDLL